MHAYVEDGAVKLYPLTRSDIVRANPNVSFPVNIDSANLEAFNAYQVAASDPPAFDQRTQTLVEETPVYDNQVGGWVQVWVVVDKPQEQIDAEAANKADEVRYRRNKLIAESDWTQLDDTPITNAKKLEWATYRQALRDIPDQAGFPWEVVWPVEPE
jgi:hypothetical protein